MLSHRSKARHCLLSNHLTLATLDKPQPHSSRWQVGRWGWTLQINERGSALRVVLSRLTIGRISSPRATEGELVEELVQAVRRDWSSRCDAVQDRSGSLFLLSTGHEVVREHGEFADQAGSVAVAARPLCANRSSVLRDGHDR